VPRPPLLLWDVGGVLLSNAWDRPARAAAAQRFGLDELDFERRHESVVDAFERGRLGLPEYLAATVFHLPRTFSVEEFRQFMGDQSHPFPEALDEARRLRKGGAFQMAVLNNESRELNELRIGRFRLDSIFDLFLSSCYTGLRKPEPASYRYALTITHRDPAEGTLLDDRTENVEAARQVGLRALLVRDPARLREELEGIGITAG
jgi:putative hydrolase of the HAD superfamily